MTPTFDRLCAILAKDYKLDAAQLTPDAPLEALGIDSLGLADLLFNLEDEFGIRMPSEPVPLKTLGDVVAFIDGLMAAESASAQPATGAAPLSPSSSTLPPSQLP